LDLDDDALVLKATDDSALGSTEAFLSSKLRYTTDASGQEICLLQTPNAEVGVMMGWEREISACARPAVEAPVKM
jgi:protein arginine N-methyltransferase 2